jgi:hypothetical protein
LIYKIGKVHGHIEFIAIDEKGISYIVERDKKKIVFTPTIIEESRLKRFRPITMPELILKLKEGKIVKGEETKHSNLFTLSMKK